MHRTNQCSIAPETGQKRRFSAIDGVTGMWFMYIVMLGIGAAVGAVLMGVYLLDGNRRRKD